MKKRLLSLLMAALLVFAFPMSVSAEEYEGSGDWTVSFDGKKLNSNFTSAQMAEEILNIQPGDSITLYVNVRNDAEKKVDLYMSNEVLQTLEDSNNSAEGGAYTYILIYHDPAGKETVLYSSDVVGGEEDTAKEGEGLHQATNGLEDYNYLDRLEKGEQGYVSLYVQLDGETQGNAYQDTLARIKFNFAVELVNDETITVETIVNKDIIKTGDESPVVMFSVITLVSGLSFLGLAVIAMNRRRREGGEQ